MQNEQRLGPHGLQGGTKYTFAATRADDEESPGIKVCPRCGQALFADMDVCYGCLYDFSGDGAGRSAEASDKVPDRTKPKPIVIPGGDDPLASIELDEIDDEPAPVTEPRHSRREGPSADDTFNLSVQEVAGINGHPSVPNANAEAFCVVVDTGDARVCVPIPSRGLFVGRGDANDIVLRSRSVSRSHLRMAPIGRGVLVEDCGATNPAMLGDEPLEGGVLLEVGDSVSVCGTTLEIAAVSVGSAT